MSSRFLPADSYELAWSAARAFHGLRWVEHDQRTVRYSEDTIERLLEVLAFARDRGTRSSIHAALRRFVDPDDLNDLLAFQRPSTHMRAIRDE